jgi:hypothetical protein
MTPKIRPCIVAVVLAIAAVTQPYYDVKAQTLRDRLDFTAGFSFTDATNIGFRYTLKQTQFGVNFGTRIFRPDDSNGIRRTHLFYSAYISQHLFGKSELSELKPWFLKAGGTFASDREKSTRKNNSHFWTSSPSIFAKLYIGREFFVSRRFGFTCAAGPYYHYFYKPRSENTSVPRKGSEIISGGVDFAFFYKLNSSSSQEIPERLKNRVIVNAGLSSTDAYNLGLTYTLGQSRIGLGIGSWGSNSEYQSDQSIYYAATFYQHFAGKSKFSALKPWYAKAGITTGKYTTTSSLRQWWGTFDLIKEKTVSARIFAGRDFNLNNRMGITIAMGPAFTYRKYIQQENVIIAGRDHPNYFYPGLDLSVFFRL